MKRSLGQKNFFCYFRYFWKVHNKSQGYFCWKCKKSRKSTHPSVESNMELPRGECVRADLLQISNCVEYNKELHRWECIRADLLYRFLNSVESNKEFPGGVSVLTYSTTDFFTADFLTVCSLTRNSPEECVSADLLQISLLQIF
jgi:hypothetical protein